MWTSTLDLSIGHILPTKILGRFWRGAYFSSLAPLQVRNLPRQPLTNGMGNWVRVHNRLAGICGSDLHLVFADGDLSIAPAALPAHSHSYPGHEVVGEVIEIGENVQHLRVGDRVVLQSGPNCLSAGVQNPCNACATGNYNLCSNGKLPGPGQIGGGWSEEMLLHEQQLFRVSDDIEDDQAVLGTHCRRAPRCFAPSSASWRESFDRRSWHNRTAHGSGRTRAGSASRDERDGAAYVSGRESDEHGRGPHSRWTQQL